MKDWGAKRIRQERVTTLGDDAYRLPQIKIWVQKFGKGHLSCKSVPCAGRLPLIREPQRKRFLEKHPFASARGIVHHVLTTLPAVKAILQRELRMKKCLRRRRIHLLSSP
jgi:hypothetical protein